jgi:hypothetical protein
MAYASSLAETILLEITVVHEGAGARKKRGVAIGVRLHLEMCCDLLTLQLTRTYVRVRRTLMLELMHLGSSSWLWRLSSQSYANSMENLSGVLTSL